jgi:tripartite-type tricarboxylate transporter receptor subunit TctC
VPNILVASNDLPANTVAELIALAKAKPGTLSYGTGGPGSPQDLSMRLFLKMAGLDILQIHYRGTSQVLPDLISNRVQLLIAPSAALLTLIEEKKLKLLGGTGAQRYATMPQTPAIAETVPGYTVDIWTGFVMPAATPDAIVKKANEAIVRALADPEVRQTLSRQGMDAYSTTPEKMREIIRDDLARWSGVIDASMKQKK